VIELPHPALLGNLGCGFDIAKFLEKPYAVAFQL